MSKGLKTKTVELTSERDKGKRFLITELPAIQADEWAHELLYEASIAGMNLKEVNVLDVDTKSMKGMIEIGSVVATTLGRIPAQRSRELKFDLLNKCVQTIPTGGEPRSCMWSDEIEDMQSFTVLFMQAIAIHVGFLKLGET